MNLSTQSGMVIVQASASFKHTVQRPFKRTLLTGGKEANFNHHT